MRRKTKTKNIAYLTLLTIAITIVISGFIYKKYYYINLENYNYRYLTYIKQSPDEQYKIMLSTLGIKDPTFPGNDNLTDDNYYVYGELYKNENGTLKRIRTIYFENSCKDEELEWLDNNTVKINGKTLNIYNDTYDYRRN